MATRRSSGPHEIGPGKPPRATQFQKGQSGNPGGRPKVEGDFAKIVDKILNEVISADSADGQRIKITKREYIVQKLVAEAAKGNLKAIDRIIDLGHKTGSSENQLIGIEPAVLASFLARFGGEGQRGPDGVAGGSQQ